MIKGFKLTEIGELPIDWTVAWLKDVSLMKSGLSITSKKISDVGLFPCYGGNGLRGFTSTYTHDGDYALIGRQGALCGNIQFASNKFFASEHAVVVTPKTNINVKWLSYVLGRMNLNQYSESSAQPGLSVKKLLLLPIPLPPTKAEQTAIATALTDADALITSLERLIGKKKAIKQGTMQELLKPKKGWTVKSLSELFNFFSTSNCSRADLNEEEGIGYVHYGDIHKKWKVFLDCSKNKIPFIQPGKVKNVTLLQDGDLVVADASEDYEGLGECLEIKNIGNKKIVAGLHTLLLRCKSNELIKGFRGYFKSYFGIRQSLILNATGVSVYGISKSKLKNFNIYLPPIEEQTYITKTLSDIDTEIFLLEKKLEKQKLIKQGMMQVLLTGKVRLL